MGLSPEAVGVISMDSGFSKSTDSALLTGARREKKITTLQGIYLCLSFIYVILIPSNISIILFINESDYFIPVVSWGTASVGLGIASTSIGVDSSI